MSPRPAPSDSRRRRQQRRALPVAALALVAFVSGVVIGAGHVSSEQKTVEAFAKAWQRGDYAVMQSKLTDAQRRRVTAGSLAARYRASAETATVRSVTVGKPRKSGDHAYVA